MYAYAFLKAPRNPIELPMGIETASTLVVCDQLAALVEPELIVDNLSKSDERLMRAVVDHDRVIQELFSLTTVLPLRFGTVFLSESHLIEHLRERQDHYLAQLGQFQHKAEYLVKLTPKPFGDGTEDDSEAEPKKGRSYFLAKKQRFQAQTQHRQQQQEELQACLRFFQEQNLEVVQGEGDGDVERLYVLRDMPAEGTKEGGDRPRNEAVPDQWQAQLAQYASWDILISEALPPYHFVA